MNEENTEDLLMSSKKECYLNCDVFVFQRSGHEINICTQAIDIQY